MHFLRHGVQGIDLNHLSDKIMREGAFVSQVPTVVGPVSVRFLLNWISMLSYNHVFRDLLSPGATKSTSGPNQRAQYL